MKRASKRRSCFSTDPAGCGRASPFRRTASSSARSGASASTAPPPSRCWLSRSFAGAARIAASVPLSSATAATSIMLRNAESGSARAAFSAPAASPPHSRSRITSCACSGVGDSSLTMRQRSAAASRIGAGLVLAPVLIALEQVASEQRTVMTRRDRERLLECRTRARMIVTRCDLRPARSCESTNPSTA